MLDYSTIAIISSGTVAVVTIIGFIWKQAWWLSDQFAQTRDVFFRALTDLENKFDSRHEDNVVRFAKIETKIDILTKNGKH